MFEIIQKVHNGSLHTTKGIYPLTFDGDITRSQGSEQIKAFNYYCSILDLIGEELITGDEDNSSKDTHFSNLRLTENGKKLLRFGNLTIDDIDNSSGKDSIKVWFLRPLAVGVSIALIVSSLTFIAGVYFSDKVYSILPYQSKSQQKNQK